MSTRPNDEQIHLPDDAINAKIVRHPPHATMGGGIYMGEGGWQRLVKAGGGDYCGGNDHGDVNFC